MLRRYVSALLLVCALFSGHVLAHQHGHDFFPVQGLEQQLQHEADSDELRSQSEEAASDLREHHRWQNARKPKMHFYPLRPVSHQAPLRFGRVFISSSGLTDATMLPGSGILRI